MSGYENWFLGFLTALEAEGHIVVPLTISNRELIGKLNYYCQLPGADSKLVASAAQEVALEFIIKK